MKSNSRIYKVSVRCFTYNHSYYIVDTLNGFVKQETSFPFVILVVDDASTDGTNEIIYNYINEHFNLDDELIAYRKDTDYATISYAQHKFNENCYIAYLFLKYNHYQLGRNHDKLKYLAEWNSECTYESICEGDDCWTDPLKLQKQVDFMDAHPDYGLCHTDYNVIDKYGNPIYKEPISIYNDDEYLYKLIAEGNCIGTLTVMLRKSVYDKTPKYSAGRGWSLGDKPIWLEIAAISKIGYIDEVTASYRVVDGSASHPKDIHKVLKFAASGFEIDNFYDNIFNLGINRPKREFYEYCLKEALRFGDKHVARELYCRAQNDSSLSLKIICLYLGAILSLSSILHLMGIFKR